MIEVQGVHKRYITRLGAGDWVLRDVNMVRRQSSYGPYNLISEYKVAA